MPIRREDALAYHAGPRPGKMQVTPTKPFETQRDLALAYTPGVAEPCRAIAETPSDVYRYTARGNLVAVVTNGTAVLGLGDIGPLASKPVMEGKGVLFKTFADIDVFDLEVGSTDPDDMVRFCQLLEPTVGGINLEDISAPACFAIENRLRETLSIPVFHDDQHGTAIITGAALLNSLEIVEKRIDAIRVVFAGAGAAAIASAEHYVRLGVPRENIVMFDADGVLHVDRPGLNVYHQRFATATAYETLADALVGADLFVGLSAGGIVTGEMVAAMAERPIVFALANPVPEILPEAVRAVRDDAIVATGRSDYPNQVNNVLGFPFIFRGALDVRARTINDAMTMAATHALADLAKEDVPDAVRRAYGTRDVRFGPEYILPTPFDPRALVRVAPAIAQAAVDSGAADGPFDLEEYRASLEARLGPARVAMRGLTMRAATDPQRIAYPEGEGERTIRAARILADDGVAVPMLLGDAEQIHAVASAIGTELDDITIIDPAVSPNREAYAQRLWERRQRKGMTLAGARRQLRSPLYHAYMMLEAGDTDGVVTGEDLYYPDAIRPALEAVGVQPDAQSLCSIYMLMFGEGTFFFSDCAVNIDPSAERLADIASATADFVWRLGIEPRVAMLSFSNFGSARHPASTRVAEAVRILHEREPALTVDGEMQADTAVTADLLRGRYPFSRLRTAANVLVFPDLNSANIAYKLLSRLGGAHTIGPILVGMARPVQVLQRGADVNDIVNMSVIAAVDAQERARLD